MYVYGRCIAYTFRKLLSLMGSVYIHIILDIRLGWFFFGHFLSCWSNLARDDLVNLGL